jgi:hypothetical protein
MRISHSTLAAGRKQALLNEYPGLVRHFEELENTIKENPDSGTKELMPNRSGRSIPVRVLSAQTEIFSGAISYSKELTAIYICSDDMTLGRIIQYLF